MYSQADVEKVPSKKAIRISVICHILVFVFILLSPDLGFFKRERPTKILWVDIPVGSSEDIQTSMKETKTLPRSTIEQQKPKEEPKKQEEKMPPPVTAKPVKKEKPMSETDKKIKSALAKIDKEMKKEKAMPPEAAQVKDAGEGFKYGTGTDPLKAMPSDPEYIKYQATVRSKIINEWIVPTIFFQENAPSLRARLEVMIDNEGEVVSVRWDNPSGNASFDASTVRAVKKASPFPKPPSRLAWEAYNEGFLVEFDPKMKR